MIVGVATFCVPWTEFSKESNNSCCALEQLLEMKSDGPAGLAFNFVVKCMSLVSEKNTKGSALWLSINEDG